VTVPETKKTPAKKAPAARNVSVFGQRRTS
jgi:hypothetical protein